MKRNPTRFLATISFFFLFGHWQQLQGVVAVSDNDTDSGVALRFTEQDLSLQVNEKQTLTLQLSSPLNVSVKVNFDTFIGNQSHGGLLAFDGGDEAVVESGVRQTTLGVQAQSVTSGSRLQAVNCSVLPAKGDCPLDLSGAFVRLHFFHSQPLYIFIQIIGWIYFVAWSVSFYPQIYLNWKRKSVFGLDFNFLSLNITGFICYAIYNCALFWNPVVKAQYFSSYPFGTIPVLLNDVVFALHAVFATALTIFQCFIYERGNQKISLLCWIILGAMWLTFTVLLILGGVQTISWLHFADYVSYIKIFVTLIKYVPQAFYNWRRKSTVGWSIGNVLLDATGGIFSLLQLFLQAYNNEDWSELFTDPTKFWLGALSLIFDSIFIVQHYVLYRGATSAYIGVEGSTNEALKVDDEESEVQHY